MYNQDKNSTLSIAEKIKLIRNIKGISQTKLAEIILTNQGAVSRIEIGDDEYDENELKLIKEYFDIAGMPLTELERKTFKGRLYRLRDLIRQNKLEEARALLDEMAKIINLEPCDFDLPTLYRIFEVLLLLAEGKLDLADEKLKYFESIYDKMSSEHRFYYYWKLGSLCGLRNNHRGALTHYTKALKIAGQNKEIFSEQSDNEERLYYNLAVCYTEIELPNRAILFLNKMNRASFKDKSSNYGLAVDITIAQNYYKAGLYDEAEKILKDCLMRASITDNKFYIGLSLQNLGIINRYLENWETAIQYFNQTLHIFEEDTRYHIWALYWKILCMIELGNLSEVERFLRDIKPSIKENDRYSIFLQTLKHITHLNRSITVYNTNAIDYIENVSVPWFIENSSKLEAVSCYKLLERHYREASRKMKSFETNKKIRTMYEEMFIN